MLARGFGCERMRARTGERRPRDAFCSLSPSLSRAHLLVLARHPLSFYSAQPPLSLLLSPPHSLSLCRSSRSLSTAPVKICSRKGNPTNSFLDQTTA
eukprot:1185903-Pleurochrysis_carterae.AAC.1